MKKQSKKLWLLRPGQNVKPDPWNPWYNKAFGFVVRATTEKKARALASKDSGNESYERPNPWLSSSLSTCVELTADGPAGIVIRDFAGA